MVVAPIIMAMMPSQNEMYQMSMAEQELFMGNVFTTIIISSALSFMIYVLYFAGFESSKLQATPAKMLLGIKVTDLQGEQISFGKALVRNISRIVASILAIGYIIIGFTEKKQGLHDIIAGCLVINKN